MTRRSLYPAAHNAAARVALIFGVARVLSAAVTAASLALALAPVRAQTSQAAKPKSTVVASTLLGGSGDEHAEAVAADASGNVYVVGYTYSANLPVRDAFQERLASDPGSEEPDAFVAKYADNGTRLVYATYLGGGGRDQALDVAADSLGNAYVVGVTTSSDFPTVRALSGSLGGDTDAFIAKLDPDGVPVYSTYFGGSGREGFNGVAVNGDGSAYATGATDSDDFPTTPGAFQETGDADGYEDAIVVELAPDGQSVAFSTMLSGSTAASANVFDAGLAVTLDGQGGVYVVGITDADNFPTVNAFQPTYADGVDGFVAKLNADGSALVYSTYFGGPQTEHANDVAVDASGAAYVAFDTRSRSLPQVRSALPPPAAAREGELDGYVAKFGADGRSLVYATYVGGAQRDQALGVAVTADGFAYVVGLTDSKKFPALRAVQKKRPGPLDAFVVGLVPDGSLAFSTYLGGKLVDFATSVTPDGQGGVYFAGGSGSANFPLRSPVQPTPGGAIDVFLARVRPPAS